jgi:hypothetical protein
LLQKTIEGLDPSKKFMHQLNKIFARETVDLIHVSDRIQAAFDYFFKPMDDLVFETIWKIEEVKRLKKGKHFRRTHHTRGDAVQSFYD